VRECPIFALALNLFTIEHRDGFTYLIVGEHRAIKREHAYINRVQAPSELLDLSTVNALIP